jgi:hypothetical protein
MQKEDAELTVLYDKVNYFDSLQGEVIDICIKLNKLEIEKDLYEKIDIPDIFEPIFLLLNTEYCSLLILLKELEDEINLINISDLFLQINLFENKNKNKKPN